MTLKLPIKPLLEFHCFLLFKMWKSGLSLFLRRYKYNSTDSQHLWSILESKSRLAVIDVMQRWTQNEGYPVISVSTNSFNKSFSTLIEVMSGKSRGH